MSGIVAPSIYYGSFAFSENSSRLKILKNTAVCVDKQGLIVAIEKGYKKNMPIKRILSDRLGWRESEVSFTKIKDGQFFFPGFIDTHIHASQYPNVGIFGETTLLDWLNTYTFPTEASMEDLGLAKKVYTRCVQRTISHGTTTAVYYATKHVDSTNILADTCLAKGQRAFIGRCCMDSEINPTYCRDASSESCIEDTRATIDYIAGIDSNFTLITPIITPRFAPSCTSQTMHGLSALQRKTGLMVQTHISEHQSEINLVQQLFPNCDNYADVYDRHGLLSQKTILAHAIHLTDEEADLIKVRHCKVSHCPTSNSALGSGKARIRWLLEKGIDVGLGTDVSGGYSTSVLETARQAILVSQQIAMSGEEKAKLSVGEVLYLATRGGAKVLGLEEKIGSFNLGMIWDAQLINLIMVGDDEETLSEEDGIVDIFSWEDDETRIAKWVFNGDDRNTLAVWVQGCLIHKKKGYDQL